MNSKLHFMKKLFLILAILFVYAPVSYAQVAAPLNDVSGEGDFLQDVVLTKPEQQSFSRMAAPLAATADVTKTFYINFDGDVIAPGTNWNYGTDPITLLAPDLTFSTKQAIVARVQELYSPYNVVVTTSRDVFLAAPVGARQQCDVVKYNSQLYSPAGGVSYINSMTWGDDTPCFVFSDLLGNTVKKVGDATAHEFGHAGGALNHDSIRGTVDGSCAIVGNYKASVGSGPLSWGSLMGNSYAGTVVTFNSNSTPYCDGVQNDMDIMSSTLGLKADDVGDDFTAATVVDGRAPFIKKVVMNSNSDVDMFKITSDVLKYLTLSSNSTTDFKVTLYDANQTQLTVLNPTNTLSIPRTNISSYVAQSGPLYISVQRSNDDPNTYVPTTSGDGSAILNITR